MGVPTYILKDKLAVPCDDMAAWGEWMESCNQAIVETQIDGYRVSTVFLGIDHRFDEAEPLLFETMVFEDEEYGVPVSFSLTETPNSGWGYARRYSFYADAEAGHRAVVQEIWGRVQAAKEKVEAITAQLSDQGVDH